MGWYEINGGIYGFNDDKVVGGESLKKLGVVLKNESRIRSRCDGKKKQVYDFFFKLFLFEQDVTTNNFWVCVCSSILSIFVGQRFLDSDTMLGI